MSTPTSTIPVPPPCVTCDHAKDDHGHEGCDVVLEQQEFSEKLCPCEAYLNPADVCIDCDGSGKLNAPGRDWDGSDCPTCGGRGINA